MQGVCIHFGDYGTAGLREQHCNSTGTRLTTGLQNYNTTTALQEQFFKSDILWARYSAI